MAEHLYADTVVIGGGTAGAAVAARLVQGTSQTVLLIESGPDYGAPPTRFLQGSFAAALVPGNATVTSARVTAAQSVPEPTGSLGWLALGGLVLGWRRLRPQR